MHSFFEGLILGNKLTDGGFDAIKLGEVVGCTEGWDVGGEDGCDDGWPVGCEEGCAEGWPDG